MKDIKIKLNIKSIMLFESITGHSFYELNGDDIIILLYSAIIVNNPDKIMTLEAFKSTLINDKITKKLFSKLQEEIDVINNIIPSEQLNSTNKESEADSKVITISEVASDLIIKSGMDPDYVLYRMQIWEIPFYCKAMDEKFKESMVDKRLWTYLLMLPNIDKKKVSGPEKLLPFPWEQEEIKKKNDEFMENNYDNIMEVFKKQEDTNGES